MKGFFNLFKSSAKELFGAKKRTTIINLVICSMLIALSMVIEALSIDLPFGKINFAFIPLAAIGMLFGPTVGIVAGGICDVLGFLVHPSGAFLPLYTLIGMFQGMIYGLILYRRWGDVYSDETSGRLFGIKATQLGLRIVAARLLDVLIVNMIFNTVANIHYGFIPYKSLPVIIATRLGKNLLELAADLPLMFIVLPFVLVLYSRTADKNGAEAASE
ncbi:MAG: folate family ECF transporter S component [Oscillospiraceae bacterium]|jgi:Predicted membrane protein|nr:folate family ECF transporter S component [Oscillospiraceae bacterium]MBQ5412307.1 folate family ECF transporter S component [Oscillospiraceae bacterium]